MGILWAFFNSCQKSIQKEIRLPLIIFEFSLEKNRLGQPYPENLILIKANPPSGEKLETFSLKSRIRHDAYNHHFYLVYHLFYLSGVLVNTGR